MKPSAAMLARVHPPLVFITSLIAIVCGLCLGSTPFAPTVSVLRTPHGGIQPQVVEKDGIVHLIYFTGEASGGDLNYIRSRDYGRTFSEPIRVNSQPGSAIATGNMREARSRSTETERFTLPGRDREAHRQEELRIRHLCSTRG